jgi:hypothetical protein
MAIQLQQALGIIKQRIVGTFTENVPVPSFFQTFFPTRTYPTGILNIEVQRDTEKIAVDVLRGTRGNRNTFSLSTLRQYLPPMYKENFEGTSLDNYDRVFGQNAEVNAQVFGMIVNDINDKYGSLRKKIERAKELQRAQVLETGVVTLKNGDNVDYKRKAGSLVDLGAAGYWNNVNAPIEAQLVAGMEFLRTQGKSGVPTANLILSGAGWINLKASDYFDTNANYDQVKLIDINMPQKQAFGAGYQGQITAGAYIINVWTYDEIYEDATGSSQRYWPVNKAVLLPTEGFEAETAHAAVPAIIQDRRRAEYAELIGLMESEYYRTNVIDKNAMAHYFYLNSAPLAIPRSVDRMYTLQISGDAQQQGG